jgi:hypothetical protein
MTTTTAIAKYDAPPSAHDPVLWRFVSRVQALTPAEWGKLDALAAPIAGRTPIAGARRLRLLTAMFRDWWRKPARELARAVADHPWLGVEFALEIAPDVLRPSFLKEMRRAAKDGWQYAATGKRPERPELPPDLPPEAKAKLEAELAENDARAEDIRRASQAMWSAAKAQPLGPGAAYWALLFAEVAIYSRDSLTPELFARLYAYMEPVIPYASLTTT